MAASHASSDAAYSGTAREESGSHEARANQNGPMASTLLLHASIPSGPESLRSAVMAAGSGGVVSREGREEGALEQARVNSINSRTTIAFIVNQPRFIITSNLAMPALIALLLHADEESSPLAAKPPPLAASISCAHDQPSSQEAWSLARRISPSFPPPRSS